MRLLIVAVVALIVGYSTAATALSDEHFFLQSYVEKSANSEYLYSVSCFGDSCSLKALSFYGPKSAFKCRVSSQKLFSDEKTSIKSGVYTLVLTGVPPCHFTNTYVFSKAGMTQIKGQLTGAAPDHCKLIKLANYEMKPTEFTYQTKILNGCDSVSAAFD